MANFESFQAEFEENLQSQDAKEGDVPDKEAPDPGGLNLGEDDTEKISSVDKIAQLTESLKPIANNRDVGNEQIDVSPLENKKKTKDRLDLYVKNQGLSDKVLTTTLNVQRAENDVAKDVPPDQQNQKRLEFKKKYIADQQGEGRARVAESVVRSLPDDAPDQMQAKERRRQDIREDLRTHVDMNDFYRRYFAILKDTNQRDRPMQLRQLESSLGQSLRKGGTAYDADTVNKIFTELTSTQEVERMSVILYQERMRIALEIDQSVGTNVSERIREIFGRNISPDEKLRIVDGLLDALAAIHTGDEELQKKLAELQGFNSMQDAANTALLIQRTEQQMAVGEGALLLSAITLLAVPAKGVPEQDKDFFVEVARSGRGALVKEMLRGPVEKLPDGSFQGNVGGEKVVLAKRDGVFNAFLRSGSETRPREIAIPLTEPDNAVGFDIARSEKIAWELNYEDIRAREDIRWQFMDRPGDADFMDQTQADKFRTMLRVLVGEGGGDHAERALRAYGVLREDRTVNEKYIDALKRCFDRWAPDHQYVPLLNEVKPADLQTLVERWKHDAENGTEGTALPAYALEELRVERPAL